MAYADYRLCDLCESKVFYDANLNYQHDKEIYSEIRNAGMMLSHTRLEYLGDWVVICSNCAKTHKCVIVAKEL